MLHFGKIPKKFGENLARFNKKFSKILAKFAKILKKSAKISAIFNEKIDIRERCKGVHCVDLGESFPTNIYLQNLASIQPRTSPTKTIPDTPIPTPPPPLKPTLNFYSNFWQINVKILANFEMLVLGCIKAKFASK